MGKRLLGTGYDPYAKDSAGRSLDGTQRLQPNREYNEYADVSLAQTWAQGRVRIRCSGQQSESWSVVTKRNDDTHAVSEVRNGAYCAPYYHSGRYRQQAKPQAQPDYWMVEVMPEPGRPWERAARADTLEEACRLARRVAGTVFGDSRQDTHSVYVAEMQRVNMPKPEPKPQPAKQDKPKRFKRKPRNIDPDVRYGKLELATNRTQAPSKTRGKASPVKTYKA